MLIQPQFDTCHLEQERRASEMDPQKVKEMEKVRSRKFLFIQHVPVFI